MAHTVKLLLDFSADLTYVAGVVPATPGVIPCPPKHPEHVEAVFVVVAIVWFVYVPVGIAERLLVGHPVPLPFRSPISAASPKVTMTQI